MGRARAGELLREHFIAQLQPDAVLVSSLFEGYVDDAVVSVGALTDGANTAVVLYDLIPFLNPDAYLALPQQRAYYQRKIASLRRAGLLLAISDYSRQEAIAALDLAPERVVAISTAADPSFQPGPPDPQQWAALRQRFGIERELLMYAPGGFDARKNIDGLISAFSLLPPAQRARHQLLIASKLGDNDRRSLQQHARQCGLAAHEVILTGYVSDAELLTLYRAAALFIFPSKHEGFGLPALEAMACGALVIGADNTSIPEVIGCAEALFDASQPAAIAAHIGAVLDDADLRQRLRVHGAAQARRFSWDITAQRTVAALEAWLARRHSAPAPAPAARPKVAFVSPLPPERTGVADYAVRLLPTLLPFCDIELVVQQSQVELPSELRHLPVRDAAWLQRHAEQYQHIVYQFGNSPFHSHMLPLLEDHPGIVVLHDFFLSSMIAYEQMTGAMPGLWTAALLHSHGYAAVQASVAAAGAEAAKQAYPANLEVLQNARHVIVHSDYACQLARDWYGPAAGRDWSQAQLPRAIPAVHDRQAARAALGIADDVFLVCNFGFVAPTKHCLELLQAWLASRLHGDAQCQLVFVGANHGGDYGQQMQETIRAAGGGRIRISGWTSDADYWRYLQAADVGVQLRTGSRGETSGTVLDCMISRLPTLINANGSLAEFPADAVWLLPDRFTQAELVQALDTLRADPARRAALSAAAFALMQVRNSPQRCGQLYQQALQRDAAQASASRRALLQALLAVPGLEQDEAMLHTLARCAALSPDPLRPRQLLVDVTAIARHDLKTGIERVVRHQLLELLQLPPCGWRVEPVYLCQEGGAPHYRYARRYAAGLLDIAALLPGPDPLVAVQAGDVFYSADHAPQAALAAAHSGLYADWRARGVQLSFLIHDLLPVLRPEFFPPGADHTHGAWLACLAAEGDRLLCISAAVAAELDAWLAAQALPRRPGQRIGVLHHGADFAGSAPAAASDSALLRQIGAQPSFLMVGTLEPRKGHLQALDAFEQLWAAGSPAQLVIVGGEGWKPLPAHARRTLPRLMARLQEHAELGKRLLWLNNADDALLQQIYAASTCLLYPSEGEGFGLPLIEAARHGLPLLARDLPVFREVAQQHASYFSGLDGAALAAALQDWLAQHAAGRHARPDGMAWRSWGENARELLALLAAP
ncbi:glycosyltransferase [Massilia sp. MB5]|uniref:glycosyltransferase n=1 Tax=Massilia sp. MB5 TaxID=2919578 RepID=UPI001F0E7159|nr:glycosyltransferase [Massilia sp. MB5]UMR31020.1 glycosyltransferase [Massilia sp. MB5]